MRSSEYDCIVIGFGGVGSAAMREAASRGWKVLGIDRYGPAHNRGSSHGQTRIIRRAYYEHPSYVPLVERAFELWGELNRRHRTSIEIKELLVSNGLLQMGPPECEVIQGVQRSALEHGLDVESLSPEDIRQRWPIFQIPDHWVGLFERDAGFLRVELCVAAAIKQAVLAGAEVQSDVQVLDWSVDHDGLVRVRCQDQTLVARHLIVAAGAWSSDLLADLDLNLTILQKQQHWFQIDRVDQKIQNGFPTFLIEQDQGDCFYGLPEIDYLGMKVSEHSGGTRLSSPADLASGLDASELKRTEAFMDQHFQIGRKRLVHHCLCMYTMSPDGHFLVDLHPQHANVAFACGLSGHGFKFAPVLGKYLVDLLGGRREPEFELFRLR